MMIWRISDLPRIIYDQGRIIIRPPLSVYGGATLSKEGRLDWSAPPKRLGWISTRLYKRNLSLQFARLAEAKDEAIVEFAGRWGPLTLRESRIKTGSERLAEWRRLARLTAAILRCASAVSKGRPSRREDRLQISRAAWPGDRNAIAEEDAQMLKLGIVAAVNRLNDHPGVSETILDVVAGRFQISREPKGLLSMMVSEIAHRVANTKPKVSCSGCGVFFVPKRLLTHGKRQYCSRRQCQKAAQRDASRDYRLRKRTE